MMAKYRSSGLISVRLLCVGVVLGALASQAAAATPLEIVKQANETVLSIYKKRQVVDASVEKEIFAAIDAVTDYKALADGAIDPLCPSLAAGQCAKFKQVFTRLLRISSIKKLGRNRADSFEYGGEVITGDSAVVRSFAFFEGERIPLDYQMARRGDGWLIVNYVIDEVDTVRNYRKQFSQLLAKKSFDKVVGQLEHKISLLEKEK